MTLAEIAEWANVPLETVRRWRKRGQLPADAERRVGPRQVRYVRAGIEAWMRPTTERESGPDGDGRTALDWTSKGLRRDAR